MAPSRRLFRAHCRIGRVRKARAPATCSGRGPGISPDRRGSSDLLPCRLSLPRTRWPQICDFRYLPATPLSYSLLHSRRLARQAKRFAQNPMSPQLARKPQNTYHHGDLREALVQAALREAEQGGAEAISIKALAKQLGVSQPAPYRHFADREALLTAVTAEAFRQLSAILHEVTRETFGLVIEALEAPAVGYLRERQALKIWAALHGVVMLAEQGLFTGESAHTTRAELVEDFVTE